MFKTLLLATLFSFTALLCFSQDTLIRFEIHVPSTIKSQNSFYKNILFLDARRDTTDLGFLIKTNESLTYTVIPKIPLADQITNLFDSINASPIENGRLLLQLKQLLFTESSAGYCSLRIQLYAQNGSIYQKLGLLDTIVEIKHGTIFSAKMEKRLFAACSISIANFISKELALRPAANESFTIDQVKDFENFEKNKLPLYLTDKYKDGLYHSFESFANQITPDTIFTVKTKNGELFKIKKRITEDYVDYIEPYDIYAVVYKGVPYITTEFGYYPLKKIGNDFFFTGKENLSEDGHGFNYFSVGSAFSRPFGVGAAGIGIGVGMAIGGLLSLAHGSPKATFYMRMDYLHGEHIPLEEVIK